MRRPEAGFTLIELLVVVIIIGILAAIAIPTFLSQREQGWQAQLVSDIRNSIHDVEAGYVANDGAYPADQDEFDSLSGQRSSPAVSLTYTTNANRSEFCVLGTHSRLPVGRDMAHYANGTGVELFAGCPAFDVP